MMLSAVRIAESAAKGVIGSLFGLSIISAVAGTTIRLQRQRRLAIDDIFVIVASLCLCASAILYYRGISAVYLEQKPPMNSTVIEQPPEMPMWSQRVLNGNMCLLWAVIFSVKFSFLFYFKIFVRRLQALNRYWWCVIGITAAVFAFSISAYFIACPYLDLSRSQCHDDVQATKRLNLSSGILGFDILTDIMIMAIPICTLWQLKAKRYQKLGLSLTLCLSICIIIAAIMRYPSLRVAHPSTDMAWEVFWHFVEACLALLTVSVNAIRPIFPFGDFQVSHQRAGPVRSSGEWFRNRKNCLHSVEEMDHLPSAPTAALTGIHTWICRSSKLPAMTSDSDENLINQLVLPDNLSRIMVTHEISTQAEHI